MKFSVLEIGRTSNYLGDRLLVIINDIAYTVMHVSQRLHAGDTAKVVGTAPWAAIERLFPWLEEQKTGDMYLRYEWLQHFLEDHVSDLFKTVPDSMIMMIPPKRSSEDPAWVAHPAGARVLATEYVRGKLIADGRSHRVHYERHENRSLGDICLRGWRVWTNRNGTVHEEDIPESR